MDEHAAPLLVRDAAKVDDDDVATVFSVVYVTASATFTGATAGFVTVGGPYASTSSIAAKSTEDARKEATTRTQKAATAKTTSAATSSVQTTLVKHTTSTNSATVSAATAKSSGSLTSADDGTDSTTSSSSIATYTTPAADAETTSSATSTLAVGTSLANGAVASSASATPTVAAGSTDSGMSGGAKAGVAFGVLIAIGLVAAAAIFLLRRKESRMRKPINGSITRSNQCSNQCNTMTTLLVQPGLQSLLRRQTRTASIAPRLSLRPVTQFLPTLHHNSDKDGVEEISGPDAFLAPADRPTSAWERRPSQNPVHDPANPFGSHAEMVDHAAEEKIAVSPPQLVLPESPSVVTLNPFAEPASAEKEVVEKEVVAPAEAQHQRQPSAPGSPTKAEIATASAVPMVGMAAGSPRAAPPNNVHRVQLDFKPSMDDELELRAGQLVRMLHEYDDGWALCIRMDRSQQGVVPRTCLSKLPVKPRPQGPPGAQGHPMSPSGGPDVCRPSNPPAPNGCVSPGPQSPMLPKPLSPNVNGHGPQQRAPTSPPTQAGRQRSRTLTNASPRAGSHGNQQRAMSPGPYMSVPKPQLNTRRRSNSMGQIMTPGQMSPTKPAPLNINFSTPSLTNLVLPSAGGVPARKPVPGQAL
ncbi:hypothetical protein H2203_003509 [Taxawa tesnikishii (nom. ined.)]|nr:hypothetical protein H2203_003509 [Dothideales sp. JES 119]